MRALWLADVLRDAGLKVVEMPGWQSHGRGELTAIKGVLLHHTGAGSSAALRNLISAGRRDLPGPLSQLFLDDDGTYYVIASGRSNHAGRGRWQDVTNGNSVLIGIEAKNAGDGKDDWPDAQMYAYIVGVAAIAKRAGFDPVMAAGHKEYALPRGRKVDPTFDMVQFREALEELGDVVTGVQPTMPTKTDPVRAMLQKGDMGRSVEELQKLLGFTGDDVDGNFGPMTDTAVRKFQQDHGLTIDGKVGPKTWAALGVK